MASSSSSSSLSSLPALSHNKKDEKAVSFGNGTLQCCRVGHKQSILLVALYRPKTKNAWNDDLYTNMTNLLHAVAADDTLSAVVLTGTGNFFSSGADLKNGLLSDDGSERQTLTSPTGQFMMALLDFPKVVAAAVNGPAVGIGVTLLLHCDIVLCSSTATFWSPFTRIALVPEFCSSVLFVERFGLPKANEMLLLGKRIDATTALQWNLVSRVVDHDTLTAVSDGDPFHPQSLAQRVAAELDERLLQLPKGDHTATIFVRMIRMQHQKERLKRICIEELKALDERFNSGECLEAAMASLKGVLGKSRL